jgi:excisionase family DNA binding protein
MWPVKTVREGQAVHPETDTAPQRRYFSLRGAAAFTTLSVNTLRRLIREGRLAAYRPRGRRVLIDSADLEQCIRGGAAVREDENRPSAVGGAPSS